MELTKQKKYLKLFLIGLSIIISSTLAYAGSAISGGTYTCIGNNREKHTLQELITWTSMEQAFGEKLYNEYMQLVSNVKNSSLNLESLSEILSNITKANWVLLSKIKCDIKFDDQMSVGPFTNILNFFNVYNSNSIWVHKDFMGSDFNDETEEVNKKRLISLIYFSLISYAPERFYRSKNTLAIEASMLIYDLFKEKNTGVDLLDKMYRLKLSLFDTVNK